VAAAAAFERALARRPPRPLCAARPAAPAPAFRPQRGVLLPRRSPAHARAASLGALRSCRAARGGCCGCRAAAAQRRCLAGAWREAAWHGLGAGRECVWQPAQAASSAWWPGGQLQLGTCHPSCCRVRRRRRQAWWPAHGAAAAGRTGGRCACAAGCVGVWVVGGGLHHWPGALSCTSLAQHQPASQPPSHPAAQPPSQPPSHPA
jgi:hypothetical protein